MPLSTTVAFGGVPIGPQQRQLAPGVDILVATPGRLLDLIDRKALALSSVQILVLDEADRMLDLGFTQALTRIVRLLPRRRQTLLFSATMPRTIAALAEDYLDDPIKVAIAPVATTADRVDQGVLVLDAPVAGEHRRLPPKDGLDPPLVENCLPECLFNGHGSFSPLSPEGRGEPSYSGSQPLSQASSSSPPRMALKVDSWYCLRMSPGFSC